MLELFQSIFGTGHPATAHFPAELVERAIERAVDGTDPRLRALSGYQKKLRAAVIHAIDHVVALVDDLPPAVDLDRQTYGSDPEVTAYFASADHLRDILSLDAELTQWRRGAGDTGRMVALLLMQQDERRVLGVALEGDILRRDVAQTTVGFSGHRLLDPAGHVDDTRRLLKRRAFDHLLTLALARIAAAHADRDTLEHDRALLRRKLDALQSGQWGFDTAAGTAGADPGALQAQLADIESQLNALGAGGGLLAAHLDIVVDVLTRAETNFWSARTSLMVDRLGIKQVQASALAPAITLTELRNAAGQTLVARLVSIACASLPPIRDWLTESRRYLA